MKYTQYPYYKAGQFLSSDDLNGSFNYLEEQIKLSRTTYGYGIISGFSYSSRNGLSIDPGIALTRDGHVIVVREPVSFDLKEMFKKYNQPLRSNPILVIRRMTCESDSEICDAVSCDVRKSDIQVKLSFELIPDQGSASCLRHPKPDASKIRPIKMRRPINPLQLCDLQVMNAVVKETFDTNKEILLEELRRLIPDQKSRDYEYYSFGTSTFLMEQVQRAMDSLSSLGHKMTEIPQHFLFHLENLKKAIMEYKVAHYDFVCKYRDLESNHPDGCIFLGPVREFDPDSLQRSVFVRNMDLSENYRQDKSRKNKLLHRIVRIVFNVQSFGSGPAPFKFIPTRKNVTLGEEVFPSYYRTYVLEDLWEIDRDSRNSAQVRYDWSSFQQDSYMDTLDEFRYFSLEGNYYQDSKKVYNTLTDVVSRYNLPFSVKLVELRKPSLHRSYDAVYQRVKELRLDEIHNVGEFLMPTFRDMLQRMRRGTDSISHLVNGVSPYCSDLLKIDTSKDRIERLPFDVSGNMRVIYDLKEIAKVISFLPKDAVLSSCAERGKTFVLLHFNNKIVATVSCSDF